MFISSVPKQYLLAIFITVSVSWAMYFVGSLQGSLKRTKETSKKEFLSVAPQATLNMILSLMLSKLSVYMHQSSMMHAKHKKLNGQNFHYRHESSVKMQN